MLSHVNGVDGYVPKGPGERVVVGSQFHAERAPRGVEQYNHAGSMGLPVLYMYMGRGLMGFGFGADLSGEI